MRGSFARGLSSGLLAISLQAGSVCAAGVVVAPNTHSQASIAAQAQQLLPATLDLLQMVELSTIARGRALTPDEIQIARRLGVTQPERVRVAVSPILPSWMAPDVMAPVVVANGMQARDLRPGRAIHSGADADRALPERRFGVAGITAGHGILLGVRHAYDPRVLAHELAHVAQYERLGMRAFALRYLTELLSVGYFRAPLELEADAAMHRVMASQQ